MGTSFLDSDEFELQSKSCVLVRIVFPDEELVSGEGLLEELESLTDTLGLSAAAEITQNMTKPNASTFCGKGKLEEIADLCTKEKIPIVVFDNELKPHQQRAIANETKALVMDRTEVILRIFAEHARTHQAKVAVDLARLQYQLPRLKNLWTHLERQRGGLGAVGGAGERQIETDRRLIRNRIARLKRELAEIEERREIEVGRRKDLFQATLVGYTNAGKSTLMNALTEAEVFAADQLFATLDTRTRVWDFDDRSVLLSDTVGFIRRLPHSLVASFHATLSEALHSDLLLHVVDASHPAAEVMIETVEEVLKELGADEQRTLLVLNKADLVKDRPLLDWLKERHPDHVVVSAKSGAGITALKEAVGAVAAEGESRLELDISAGNGKLLAFLKENCKVLSEDWQGMGVKVVAMVEARWLREVNELNAAMPYQPSEEAQGA